MNYFTQPYGAYMQPYMQPYMPQYVLADGSLGSNENALDNRLWQQSYIENILRANIGKTATVYMNFEGSQWGSKVFKGTILAAGRDHVILKDNNGETRYMLLLIYLCYVVFEESINYDYPFRSENKSN